MNKEISEKFDVDDFFSRILNKYKDWNTFNDIEKSRCIYIELGKYFSYDEKYLTSKTLSEKQEIFDKPIEDIEGDKAVCSGMTRVYVSLLKRAGIESEEIYSSGKFCGHLHNNIKIGNRVLSADLTNDIRYIKRGFKTNNFNFLDDIDTDLQAIDDKLGYTYKGMYMDETIEVLKREMRSLNTEEGQGIREDLGIEGISDRELLEFKINFILEHFDFDGLYCIEKTDYFEMLIRACISKDEIKEFNFEKNLKKISCIEDESKLRIFHIIHDEIEDDDLIYTSSDDDTELRVDPEFIEEKLEGGLTTLSKGNIEFLQALVNKYKSKNRLLSDSILQTKTLVTSSMIREHEKKLDELEQDRVK